MSDYVKLSSLVNDTFTVVKAWGYKYKKWDNEHGKMLVSEKWPGDSGYQKVYDLDTDKGKLDLKQNQLGQVLASAYWMGVADINGKTFKVTSNGKSGMDIRYYFNVVDTRPLPDKELNGSSTNDEIDLESIPF